MASVETSTGGAGDPVITAWPQPRRSCTRRRRIALHSAPGHGDVELDFTPDCSVLALTRCTGGGSDERGFINLGPEGWEGIAARIERADSPISWFLDGSASSGLDLAGVSRRTP